MLYELYLVTNIVTNKRYVGQTLQSIGYEKRWKRHVNEAIANRKNSRCYLHNSIVHYGPENFVVKRLLKNIEEKDIDRLECLNIIRFNTYYKDGYGYNMTHGGQGVHGYRHTEQTKLSISNTLAGRTIDASILAKREATKRMNGYYAYRKNCTDWRKKLSVAAKERYKHNDNPFKNKHHSDRTKDIISKANGAKVSMLDLETGEVLQNFQSAMVAGNYLQELGLTSNKTPNCRILSVCKGKALSAYGYAWKFTECID